MFMGEDPVSTSLVINCEIKCDRKMFEAHVYVSPRLHQVLCLLKGVRATFDGASAMASALDGHFKGEDIDGGN